MAKRIDFITFRVTAFIFITAWSIYITDSLVWGLIIGIALFILFNLIYSYYEKKKRPYTLRELSMYFAMHENPVDIIVKLLPENISYIRENNALIMKSGEILYTSFGFSQFSMNDMLKAVKYAKAHNSSMLTIVTSDYDRQIYSLLPSYPELKISIFGMKQLMKTMIKKNLLPDIKKRPKRLNNLSEIFTRQMGGRFLLSGSIIALMSIVMPIKLYYLLISLICFTLGIICMINPRRKDNINSILK